MITGFSYDTRTGEWKADWKTSKSWTFRQVYHSGLGYFLKLGKKIYYLTDQEVEQLENSRMALQKTS